MRELTKKVFAMFLAVIIMAASVFSFVSCDKSKNAAEGIPGADGDTPFIGENGNWWIGNVDTGVLAAGTNGRDGLDGKDGAAGVNGTNGADGKDGVSVTSFTINDAGELVVMFSNSTEPQNLGRIVGTDGDAGEDGKDGVSVTSLTINDAGELVVMLSNSDKPQNLGKIVGTDGAAGKDGKDGIDGVSVTSLSINGDGELVVIISDSDEPKNLGKIVGTDGIDGVGIKTISKEEDKLIITLTDGTVYNFDGIKGEKGKDGINGEKGETGADGKTPELRINEDNQWEVRYGEDGEWVLLGGVATGPKGEDGKTPIIRIENGYWEYSYDNGSTWTKTDVKATGTDGANGKDGLTPKLQIVDGQIMVSYDDWETYEIIGTVSNGDDGNDGVGINEIFINDDGELIVILSNETELNLGNVKGADGKDGKDGTDGTDGTDGKDGENGTDGIDGKDGRGIKSMDIVDGELWVTYTDETKVNLGKVVSESSGESEGDGATTHLDYTEGLIFYPLINENGEQEYGVALGTAKYMPEIVIPKYYNGKPVTTIVDSAFATTELDNAKFTTVIIPEGIKAIWSNAFSGYTNLETITLPSTIEYIGSGALDAITTTVEVKMTKEEFGENVVVDTYIQEDMLVFNP